MLYAYSVKEPIGELNLKRALDEDTGVFSSFFSLLSSSSPLGQTTVSRNSMYFYAIHSFYRSVSTVHVYLNNQCGHPYTYLRVRPSNTLLTIRHYVYSRRPPIRHLVISSFVRSVNIRVFNRIKIIYLKTTAPLMLH